MRRKDYKVIADGLISSFISRNNDVHGYWGIGKLYSLGKSLDSETIVIDLLNRTINPKADNFNAMVDHFADKLKNYQQHRGLTSESLIDAKIKVIIQNENISIYDSYEPNTLNCRIQIVCDNGTNYSKELKVRCRPHNPRREWKSTRNIDE